MPPIRGLGLAASAPRRARRDARRTLDGDPARDRDAWLLRRQRRRDRHRRGHRECGVPCDGGEGQGAADPSGAPAKAAGIAVLRRDCPAGALLGSRDNLLVVVCQKVLLSKCPEEGEAYGSTPW